MRTLAIDLGDKRIGLAIGDEGGAFATPYAVLDASTQEHNCDQILHIIRKEQVRRIVVGLPLNMDDSIGPAARKTAAWARLLAERAALPVLLVDERLSSYRAEQQLLDRKKAGEKLTRGKKKQRQDALAAAAFLQDFLDGKLLEIPQSQIQIQKQSKIKNPASRRSC
jgi:putative Holliday junction resolvase